ncbi:hypothetical protein PIB30_007910 [Stylosanthes scabra]|uniref:Transposase (putative) gypsy type domain-containing protein n=1 Tax=Stylosanthes scabra TaxID=79078 RepID=A0ABU6S527_9FABA|nr:hypothetical protein [Stylosanthes scabra]
MTSVSESGVVLSPNSGYEWVSKAVWSIPTKFVDIEGLKRLGPPSAWVKKGSNVNVEFLPCLPSERVCHKGPNGSWFFMYTCVLAEIGVRFPFTAFECSVLRHVNCAPSQIHPNSWGFMRTFQVLMEYLEEPPSLITGGLADREADLVEFIFLHLKGGKMLTTSEVVKWDSDRQAVVKYFETKIPDCNTSSLKSFFKQRAEKELSNSHVVKLEKGVEVNKPSERKRPVSLKMLRSEEASGKRVIDLTDAKCCGKEVSLKEVADFTKSQEMLHGFNGIEDLSSLWCEHYPFLIIADEHFQSKADLELLGKVGKVATTRYMQVEAARLLCISRELEVQAMEEESSQQEKKADLEKENKLLIEENNKLKTKVTQLTKDKSELENRIVELVGEKKEAEVSKKAHRFEMFAAAWDRAKAQVELFVPGVNLKKMDPVKVVYKGQLVDDDQVPADGSDDHNPND